MVSSPVVHSGRSLLGVFVRIAIGIVAAPLVAFCAGAATVTYLSVGVNWLGLLMAMVLVAAAVLITAWSPLTGMIAGGLIGVLMIYFVAVGIGAPTSRPSGGIDGIIVFGATGLLTAALIAAFITTALATGIAARRNGS
jgi:hypothetical protein